MKPNILVWIGAIGVLIVSYSIPVATVTDSQGSFSIFARPNVFVIALILLSLLMKWKWRGAVWIALSLLGAIFTPIFASTLYSVNRQLTEALGVDSTVVSSSFGIGLALVFIGYVVIIGAGIWDINLKRNSTVPSP